MNRKSIIAAATNTQKLNFFGRGQLAVSEPKRCGALTSKNSSELRRLLTVEFSAVPILNFHPTDSISIAGTQEVSVLHLADMDGDGREDYIQAETNSIGFHVAIRNPATGRADESHDRFSFAFPGSVTAIETADFNGDGFDDVAATSSAGTIVLLNRGNDDDTGEWQQLAATVFLPGEATSLSIGDLNHDGVGDLAIGMQDKVKIVHLTGEGTVALQIDYTTEPGDRLVDLADINGDQHLDLVTLVPQSGNVIGLLNDGTGFLETTSTTLHVGSFATVLVAQDIYGDGSADLVVGNATQDFDNLSIWKGLGDGTFRATPKQFPIFGPIREIDVADYDADKHLDLLVTHGGTFHHPLNNNGPGGMSLLLGAANGELHDPIRVATNDLVDAAFADLDGDGLLDLVAGQSTLGQAIVVRQRTAGLLANRANHIAFDTETQTKFLDINMDGFVEAIAISNTGEFTARVSALAPTNGGGFAAVSEIDLELKPQLVTTGDFDGDEKADLAIIGVNSESQPQLSMVRGGENQSISAETADLPVGQWTQIISTDLNADGRDDIVAASGPTSNLYVLLGRADGGNSGFTQLDPISLPNVAALQAADLSGDGVVDLIVGTQTITTLRGNGDGTFTETSTFAGGVTAPTIGDFNGDGDQDLVFTSGLLTTTAYVKFGNGDGSYENSVLISKLDDFTITGAVDVNGDGITDLVMDDSIYFGGPNGFSSPNSYSIRYGGNLAHGDLDGDDVPDLIVSSVGPWTANFYDFATFQELRGQTNLPLIEQGRRVTQFSAVSTRLESLDFDDDGDFDTILVYDHGFVVSVNDSSPPPLSTDLNGDGQSNAADVDALCEQFGSTDPSSLAVYDLNHDGNVNFADTTSLVEEGFETQLGDANLDGNVDFRDFLVLSANFGKAGEGWSGGDFNCDGRVNFFDFLQQADNFGF